MNPDIVTRRENLVPNGSVLMTAVILQSTKEPRSTRSIAGRIAELQEQIKDKKEQVGFKELRREGAKTIHNYKV